MCTLHRPSTWNSSYTHYTTLLLITLLQSHYTAPTVTVAGWLHKAYGSLHYSLQTSVRHLRGHIQSLSPCQKWLIDAPAYVEACTQ